MNIERALQLKLQALNKETSEQIIKAGAEEFQRRLDYEGEQVDAPRVSTAGADEYSGWTGTS